MSTIATGKSFVRIFFFGVFTIAALAGIAALIAAPFFLFMWLWGESSLKALILGICALVLILSVGRVVADLVDESRR